MPKIQQTPVKERFWKYVAKSPGCWLWTGAKRGGGYGAIWIGGSHGQHSPAHRVSYEITTEQPIPNGLLVLHKCNNKSCVNPGHLYLGNAHDNALDAIKAGTWPDTRGQQRPTMRGEMNHNAVMTEAGVLRMRHLHRNGTSARTLAKLFSVDRKTVALIVKRITWKHI